MRCSYGLDKRPLYCPICLVCYLKGYLCSVGICDNFLYTLILAFPHSLLMYILIAFASTNSLHRHSLCV